MEWYFSNEVEDLVVPKDYEQAGMIESWSQWGMEASYFPKKNFTNTNTNMTREELAFNGGKNFYTNNSSMNQGLYNNTGSLLWNDQADFQQFTEEEARINHMDDLFFSSLLEEDPAKDSNIFEDDVGNSKYLKAQAFSPSNEWTHQMPNCTEEDDNSMEESVLKDLEMVTMQFTDKTRICFRDAFYRLAESSAKTCQETACDGDTMRVRGGERQVSESKTNVIDRAVASLMFNKLDKDEEYDDDAEVPITAY